MSGSAAVPKSLDCDDIQYNSMVFHLRKSSTKFTWAYLTVIKRGYWIDLFAYLITANTKSSRMD